MMLLGCVSARRERIVSLALVGCVLVARNIDAQETPRPMATRAELRERFRDVTKALKWPTMGRKRSATELEEFRVLVGSGSELPGVAFRSSRTSANATGSAAFWWIRGRYSQSIRKSFEEGPTTTCKRIDHSGYVEVCDLARPISQATWSSIWASGAAADVRSQVLKRPAVGGSDEDTAVAAVQWFDGSRVAELFQGRDTSVAGSQRTKGIVCLVGLLFERAAPPGPGEEAEPIGECH
jgi:hypothetical protein